MTSFCEPGEDGAGSRNLSINTYLIENKWRKTIMYVFAPLVFLGACHLSKNLVSQHVSQRVRFRGCLFCYLSGGLLRCDMPDRISICKVFFPCRSS